MENYDAYRLGLIESVGDDVLGNRVPLTEVLLAAEEYVAAKWYAKGWAVGDKLVTSSDASV